MENKHCYYTLSCIIKNTLSCIRKINVSLYIVSYNRNVCYHYTLSCIMRNTLSCILKMFVVII